MLTVSELDTIRRYALNGENLLCIEFYSIEKNGGVQELNCRIFGTDISKKMMEEIVRDLNTAIQPVREKHAQLFQNMIRTIIRKNENECV